MFFVAAEAVDFQCYVVNSRGCSKRRNTLSELAFTGPLFKLHESVQCPHEFVQAVKNTLPLPAAY